jgi:steroid 5-alpha reductase family enzyme
MPDLLVSLVSAALAMVVAMTLAFAVRLWTGRSGWIDTIWSAAVGVAGLVAIVLTPGDPARRWMLGAVILLWSARLASHIGSRTHGAGDDPRYAALVAEWGENWRGRLFWFLQAQAGAGWVLAAAIAIAAANPAPPRITDALAVAVALLGIGLELTADRQLRAWRATQQGPGVCDVGLWSVSRHPNYLGETLFWGALPLFAVAPDRLGWAFVTVAAPAMMAYLLVAVSGIPLLEAHMARTRGAAWEAYCRRVPKFLPKLRLSGRS